MPSGRGMSSLGERANLSLPRPLITRISELADKMSRAAGRQVSAAEALERLLEKWEAGQ
jgi:hypothetical protein